jgi:hypothetical protein
VRDDQGTSASPPITVGTAHVADLESSSDSAAGWEAAGRKIAPMLGSYSAAVVTSSDELAAAYVALGIGLAEAEHRRVAIGDLVGEVEPLQSLITSDDPHGISDSFTFGVSLNKIAQPIDSTGNLFVMPSGTGSVAEPEIFRNSRWQRLANGFREVGALLLLVAPADAPGLKELIDQMDGVVLVGASRIDSTYMHVLARVPAPLEAPPSKAEQKKKKLPIWRLILAVLLLVGFIGAGMYVRYLDLPRRNKAVPSTPPVADTMALATLPPPAETLLVAPPENVADSANAAAYAVELAAYNTHESALMRLRQIQEGLPSATIAPVPIGSTRETYYKLIAGAFTRQQEANTFLARLRRTLVLSETEGTVVRTPYALLLDSAEAGRTQLLVQKYAGTPHPVYVLVQPDGSLKLYAGAFERPEDSAALLMALRSAQLNPVLVYRTGRTP